jgi:DNA-directed RNA polymerase subunit RPC12/RpoP/signal peptidase I
MNRWCVHLLAFRRLAMTAARRIAILLAALAVALVAARFYLLQGLISVVTIDGGSMGESFPGEHVRIVCAKCSRQWLADHEQFQSVSYITCPECGQAIDDATVTEPRPGTRVLIDRAAYLLEKPKRFDVVAFATEDGFAIKRIVALPGEEWRIEEGEIHVDGKLVRKSYPQFRELATVMAATSGGWRPAEQDSPWRQDDGIWRCESSSQSAGRLAYHHQAAHPAARDQPLAVQDLDAYNPAESRELNEVADVFAECDVEASGVALECRVHAGREDLIIRWDPAAREVVARSGKRELARTTAPAVEGRCDLAWGLCDRQLFFVINEHVLLRHELALDSAKDLSAQPLSLEISGDGICRIESLRVLRDIYYLDAQRLGGQWKATATDGYGVLGDNPPVSIDSRHWEDAIQPDQILGRVFKRN